MKTMTRTAMVVMAVVLAVATAATAATAFAGDKKRLLIEEQVADSVQATSEAMLRLKIKFQPRGNRKPPSVMIMPAAGPPK